MKKKLLFPVLLEADLFAQKASSPWTAIGSLTAGQLYVGGGLERFGAGQKRN